MQTRFTDCCNHCFQLTRDVLKVYTDHVSPQVWALKDDGSRTDTPRDTAIVGTFGRVEMWLHSVTKLNQTLDAQAVATAARSLFELLLDLAWLRAQPEPEWAAHAFTLVFPSDTGARWWTVGTDRE